MKKIYILLFLAFNTLHIAAQPNSKGERIESLKIAHISSKLNLDPQTAERFWPVYHQYENELLQVVKERRRLNQSDNRSSEDILEQEQKALDIKKKYNAQFQRIISPEQLNTLYGAEKEFRQMLIRKARRIENESYRNENNPRGNYYNDRESSPQNRPSRAMPPKPQRMDMDRRAPEAPANRPSRMDKPSR